MIAVARLNRGYYAKGRHGRTFAGAKLVAIVVDLGIEHTNAKGVAQALGVPTSTAYRWIQQARGLGLLTKPGQSLIGNENKSQA